MFGIKIYWLLSQHESGSWEQIIPQIILHNHFPESKPLSFIFEISLLQSIWYMICECFWHFWNIVKPPYLLSLSHRSDITALSVSNGCDQFWAIAWNASTVTAWTEKLSKKESKVLLQMKEKNIAEVLLHWFWVHRQT